MFPAQYVRSGNISNPTCPGNVSWNDPTDDILTAFNEMMFRSAIQAAGSEPILYNLAVPDGGANKTFSSQNSATATQSSTRNIYLTNYKYVVGSAVVMMIAILAVIPTFEGFWHLGRSISMNPIEVAKAFDAPILGGPAALSNADIDLLDSHLGKRRVLYGEILQHQGQPEKKLTMGDSGQRISSPLWGCLRTHTLPSCNSKNGTCAK